jgi:putative sigma-54 modulation protein
MELQTTGRNMELTQRLEEYVQRKADKLDRFMPAVASARMDLSLENARSAADRQVAQFTIRSDRGVILRAEVRTGDMFASIDAVVDKMHRQIVRYKGKRQRARRAVPAEDLGLPIVEDAAEEDTGEIVRVKRFSVVPMMQEEAIEQMELLGHDFFVYYSAEENGINVLYSRSDKGYGLLIPEVD